MAGTGLDEHHALLHDLPIRTLELHGKGGGSVGVQHRPSVHTPQNLARYVFMLVQPESSNLIGLEILGSGCTFAFLNVLLQVSFARPDHAEAALLLQPAECVVIGNPGGDAHSAGLGTGTPLCGLDQAVGSDHGWVWAKRVFRPVSCERRADHGVLLGLITHPFLAAFPGQFDPPREGAVGAGQADVHAA